MCSIPYAIWTLTPKSILIAKSIATGLHPNCLEIFIPSSIQNFSPFIQDNVIVHRFEKLSKAVSDVFHEYRAHIFIMSVGIVVRTIAPHLKHKTVDPAVVVIDDAGHYAISLLSGHIGGANALTLRVANQIGAQPVITTATDVNGLPAIDVFAMDHHLTIENPEAIKTVNMAILTNQSLRIHDPFDFLKDFPVQMIPAKISDHYCWQEDESLPGICIDDRWIQAPKNVLVLRPKTLIAGIGCNRHTDMIEIKTLLIDTLKRHLLSLSSLVRIATIDAKQEENGLIELSKDIGIPLTFYTKDELNRVTNIPTPSEMVKKHMGTFSVCEAAALLASKMGKLIVPKQLSKNATVAIARVCLPVQLEQP